MQKLMTSLAALAFASAASAAPAPGDDLKLNQIQVVGTHNSYSQPADPRVFSVMKPLIQPTLDGMMKMMPPAMAARFADEHPNPLAADLQAGLEYVHPPIEMQLRAGLRSLEFDLNVDHEGGRFSDPLAYRLLREKGARDLAPLYSDALKEPGLKTLHAADIDFRSSCPTFRLCLQQMRAWSDANRGHSPVFVLLEPKFSSLAAFAPDATKLIPFDAKAFAEMDASIGEIIGRERVVAPDDLRGRHQTLEEAALAGAWPTVGQARGKFVFLMIVPGMNLEAFKPYLDGHPNLEGRLAFVQGEPGMAHAAFVMVDNALTRGSEIRELVASGRLVRSRSDIDTFEARQNDVTRRDAALASGAQIVSTDYPWAPNVFGNDYEVKPFAGGFRCNPVTGGAC
ncbi:Ca2+-dependent phosphoinositide-specific phospholipase C [Phenylobacterium sp.]|uniref:Ca2+-dependent phosphoinositide-specific phospholipase C n=1 Tax=Phenylobacterium sp. TaxID=1871053 RepID=UPI00289A4FDD|nr:Ca2+-dependent phosphoinositide-specific phospholipase C [Phenylobacterium sp.]